jgi:hypothetical protein
MRKNKTMTLDEHIETANDLAIATHHLRKSFFRCQKHYNKTSKLMKLLYKVCPGVLEGIFTKIINEKEFNIHGHIYYNLDDRYKQIHKTT